MINNDDFEWAYETYDFDDLDMFDEAYSLNVVGSQTLNARQRLELYWENKRLRKHLSDVFADDDVAEVNTIIQAMNLQDIAQTNHSA